MIKKLKDFKSKNTKRSEKKDKQKRITNISKAKGLKSKASSQIKSLKTNKSTLNLSSAIEMEGRPAFMQLIERNERRESLGPMRESSGMRPVRKIKVKALKGSPYVISLEKSDLVGEGSYGSVVRVFDLDHRDEELVAKVIPLDDKIKLAAIEAELRILIRLPLHPNLVNYKKIRVSSADK